MNPQQNPAQETTGHKNFQKGKFDANASTFRHEFYMKPSEKQPILYGYSASVGTPEAVNKTYVLASYMYRLLPTYLPKCMSIMVYRRNDFAKGWDKRNEYLYCRITHKGVEMFEENNTPVETTKNAQGERLIFATPLAYLTELVRNIKNEEYVAKMKPKIERPSSMDKYYQELLASDAFETVEELKLYCRNRIAQGEAPGRMEAFERDYMSQYFADLLHEPVETDELTMERYDQYLASQNFTTQEELNKFCQDQVSAYPHLRDRLVTFWRGYKIPQETAGNTITKEERPTQPTEKKKNDVFAEMTEQEIEEGFVHHFAQTYGVDATKERGSAQWDLLLKNYKNTLQKRPTIQKQHEEEGILEGINEDALIEKFLPYLAKKLNVKMVEARKLRGSEQWNNELNTYKKRCQQEGRLL